MLDLQDFEDAEDAEEADETNYLTYTDWIPVVLTISRTTVPGYDFFASICFIGAKYHLCSVLNVWWAADCHYY